MPPSLRALELSDLRDRYVAGLSEGLVVPDQAKIVAKTAHEKVQDTTVRAQSAYSLGSLGMLGEQVEKPLRKALRDTELYVRLCAIQALGDLGQQGAISDLEAAKAGSKDERERKAADDAIAKIRAAKPQEPGVAAMVDAIHKFKTARK